MESKDQKNAILAVVISGIILFGWNYFFAPPVYDVNKNKIKSNVEQKTETLNKVSQEKTSSKTSDDSAAKDVANLESKNMETIEFKTEDGFVKFNNNLEIIEYSYKNVDDSALENFKYFENILLISREGVQERPFFEFSKIAENSYEIKDQKLSLNGVVSFKNGLLNVSLNSTREFTPKFKLKSKPITNEDDDRKSNSFVYYGDDLEQAIVGEEDSDFSEFKFKWFGLDYHYHLLSFALDTSILGRVDHSKNYFSYRSLSPMNKFSYKVIYAKKNYDDLVKIGNGLEQSVDFGMWGIIAIPILRGLQFFFDLTKNYGLAIILLTIIIRLLTFPLQYKSFKSMKKMQVIQPELQKIREKHKENPQKMQQETMALFKKAGANPLSGCLPMIAQMPVFFAFYQVLFTSTELVGAPFYFWIHDLSEKDPFYILPVLMGLAMFLNMKLTPSTSADPAQQKIMMFMPVIFSLFMLNLPSGLTLYILISTLVGMGQQLFVYKRTA